jgi:hypothetical protein
MVLCDDLCNAGPVVSWALTVSDALVTQTGWRCPVFEVDELAQRSGRIDGAVVHLEAQSDARVVDRFVLVHFTCFNFWALFVFYDLEILLALDVVTEDLELLKIKVVHEQHP